MKSHVVQPITLARLENLLPRIDIRRWIAGQQEIATEMCAAKINGVAVENELIPRGAEIADAKRNPFYLIIGQVRRIR